MRPKSAGCGSLSECITHLRAKSHFTGQTLVAGESVCRNVFQRGQVCLGEGFLW